MIEVILPECSRETLELFERQPLGLLQSRQIRGGIYGEIIPESRVIPAAGRARKAIPEKYGGPLAIGEMIEGDQFGKADCSVALRCKGVGGP